MQGLVAVENYKKNKKEILTKFKIWHSLFIMERTTTYVVLYVFDVIKQGIFGRKNTPTKIVEVMWSMSNHICIEGKTMLRSRIELINSLLILL